MAFLIKNIMWIMLVLLALLAAGGYVMIRTNLLQKIRDKMNPNSDKFIQAKVFCEDKQIRDRREKIGRYCVQDDQRRMGWHLVHDLLVTSKGTGKQFLCLSERNDFPIDFHGVMTPENAKKYPNAQNVFLDSTADIRSQAAKEAAKTLMSNTLSIIALAGALVFVVFAIILFWGNRGGA
jgi:hypothetical protein